LCSTELQSTLHSTKLSETYQPQAILFTRVNQRKQEFLQARSWIVNNVASAPYLQAIHIRYSHALSRFAMSL